MYDLNNKSINFIKNDPLFLKLDAGPNSVLVGDFIKNLKKMESVASSCPIQEITKFYLIDQCFFMLEKKYGVNQNLPPDMYEVAKMMKKEMTLVGNKIFYFLIQACISEIGRFGYPGQNATFYEYIASAYGQEFAESLNGYGKKNATAFAWGQAPKLDHLKHMSLEKFVSAMVAVFCSGKWHFGAGGTGWGNIAKAANNFLRGTMSLHETADFAFSLCHDRGSYFDRSGFGVAAGIFKMKLNLNDLYTILDVQASGQIPQFVKANPQFLDAQAKKIFNIFALVEPGVFGAKLDQTTIRDSKSKREAALQAQWKASQAHHNVIAGVTTQKALDAAAHPPVEAIDKILIADYKAGLR